MSIKQSFEISEAEDKKSTQEKMEDSLFSLIEAVEHLPQIKRAIVKACRKVVSTGGNRK